MTAQSQDNPYHYCESCEAARNGAPVPYDQLDLEVMDVVRALNTVPGMRTIDSCFGHAGSGDPNKSHSNEAYFGLAPVGNRQIMEHFWSDFFADNYGKVQLKTGLVQFNLVYFPFDPDPESLIRLYIDTEHDPVVDSRGDLEKKEAFLFLQKFIATYLKTHQNLVRAAQVP